MNKVTDSGHIIQMRIWKLSAYSCSPLHCTEYWDLLVLCVCVCVFVCVCVYVCSCVHLCCVWVWSNYLHQLGVVLIICNFFKNIDWVLMTLTTFTVSLSKESINITLADIGLGGLGVCPLQPFSCLLYLCIQIPISSTKISETTKIYQLIHRLLASHAQVEPMASFCGPVYFGSRHWCLVWPKGKKFCLPSCLLLNCVSTPASSLTLCFLSEGVLYSSSNKLCRKGKVA